MSRQEPKPDTVDADPPVSEPTQIDSVVQRKPPLVADPALDTWSVDLPVPPAEGTVGDALRPDEEGLEAFAEAPSDDDPRGETRLLPSEPVRIDAPDEEPPEGEFDDGWGGRAETGAITQSHSVAVDRDGTGSVVPREPSNVGREAPRLVCIQGPDKGKEFVLTGRDISIGRGPENDVVIGDSAMSRVHCRLLLTEGQALVTDQRSANGTIVNGSKVDRAQIKSGGTIKLGQSLFRFIEMGDVIKPAETQDPTDIPAEHTGSPQLREVRVAEGNRKVAMGILAGGAIVALVIVLLSIASSMRSHPTTPKPAEVAEEHFAAGVTALKDKHIDEALDQFREAAAEMPDEPRYARHVHLAEQERGNLQNINDCQTAIKADNLLLARTLVSRIAADTIYSNDLQELKQRVTTLTQERGQSADALLGKRKFSASERENASKVLADLQVVEPEAARTRALADRLQSAPTPHTRGERNERAVIETRDPTADAGVRTFQTGSVEQAISATNDAGVRGKLQKFAEAYKEARAAGRGPGALPVLRKALAAEQKIDSGTSHYAQELKPLIADADCDAAAQALVDQRNPEAYRLLKEAQTLVPGHAIASKKLGELSGRARDLFNQGYILKDSDLKLAREKWKTVLGMVPSEDEAYQKAKKWLDLTK